MKKVRVLVVDDNRRIVNLLKNALEKEEEVEVVGTASDGEEALQMIHLKRPDVVLLDLIMPKIDGLGVMERMQRPDFPVHPQVIVVSAISQESVTEHAFALGAAYYRNLSLFMTSGPVVVMVLEKENAIAEFNVSICQ